MHKHIAVAVGILTFATGAFSPATAHPPTVRTNRGVIVTKTSAAPFSIVVAAKQRLEIYSAAPQSSGPLGGGETLLGCSLAQSGVTFSYPMLGAKEAILRGWPSSAKTRRAGQPL